MADRPIEIYKSSSGTMWSTGSKLNKSFDNVGDPVNARSFLGLGAMALLDSIGIADIAGLTLTLSEKQNNLIGTGFVKSTNGVISYDTNTYVVGTPWGEMGYWYSSSHPTTILGYGITDIPTTLPASDVYSWAKNATKPTYTSTEVGAEPSFSKNTGFNKNFGAIAGTVLEGRTFGSASASATTDFAPASSISGLSVNTIPKWNGTGFVDSYIFTGGATTYFSNSTGTKLRIADLMDHFRFDTYDGSDFNRDLEFYTGTNLLFVAKNIGINVTPTDGGNTQNIEMVGGSTFASRTLVPQLYISSNAVGQGYSPTYKVDGYAAQYVLQGFGGTHQFNTAISGITGDPISFIERFSILNNGNVDVGFGYGTYRSEKFSVNGNAYFASTVQATTAKLTNLTDGYLPYHISDASGLDNSGFYWDAVNQRGGIGTTLPNAKLEVLDTMRMAHSANYGYQYTVASNDTYMDLQYISENSPFSNIMTWQYDGNVGIGYSTGTEITNNRLAVNGSGYFNGNVTVTSATITTGAGLGKVFMSDATGNGAWATSVIAGSFSGIGTATTVFTVTIGQIMANTTYKVNVTPTDLLAAALFYVTNKQTTTFDVTYLTGLTGTVTFDYAVFP